MIKNFHLKIEEFILDTLFPISCLSCQKEDVWLCDECLIKIETLDCQVCPYCEKEISAKGEICPRCRQLFLSKNSPIPIDNLLVSSSYKNPLISRLVHLYKYNFIEDLHHPLGYLILDNLLKNNTPLPDLIIPVPLHPRRERWRGFNQSKLLANYISAYLMPGINIPISEETIFRQKYTSPQMSIKNFGERKKNIESSFTINPTRRDLIADKNILLIDDIATTGATLFEVGKLLRKNGAKRIMGAVIARQDYGN